MHVIHAIKHMDAAENVLCSYVCIALFSCITYAYFVTLSVTKRLPVHFIITGHLEYELVL